MIADGTLQATTSELTLAEVLVRPFRQNNHDLVAGYEQLSQADPLSVKPITAVVLKTAAELRARIGIKLPDAVHLATARLSGCSAVVSQDQRTRLPGLEHVALADIGTADK